MSRYESKLVFLTSRKYFIGVLAALMLALLVIITPHEHQIKLILTFGVVILFGIIAIRNFLHALYILLFIFPLLFSFETGGMLSISLQGLVSIMIIVISIPYFQLKSVLTKGEQFPAVKPFLFILLYSSLGFSFSPDPISLLIKLGRLASYLSLYVLLVANINSLEKVESSIKVVYFSYLIPFLIAILQFVGIFFGEHKIFLELEKIGVMSKNTFGITVAMLTLFLIGEKFLLTRTIIQLLRNNIFYLVPLVIVLILSVTRTAWIGFIGALFLVLAFYGRRKNRIVILLCLLAIVLTLWSPIVKRTADLTHSMGTPSTNSYSGSLEGRVFLYWPQGIEAWLERPILGHGLGSTKYLTYRASNVIQKSPHNEYIQILQETGIVGCILYLFLLWRFVQPIRRVIQAVSRTGFSERRKEVSLGAGAVFIGFLIISFGQETFHNGFIGTFLIVFMAIAQANYLLIKESYQIKMPPLMSQRIVDPSLGSKD